MSAERRERSAPGPGPGMGFMGRGPMMMGMPMQKAKNPRGTLNRLLGYFMPQRYRLALVFLMAVLSTVFSIVSPKIMGLATTKLFAGVVLRLRGLPGAGVDFGYIRHILLILGVLYVASAFFGYLQQYIMSGVAQRTVYTLRKEVDEN